MLTPSEALSLLNELKNHEVELEQLVAIEEEKPLAVGDLVRVNYDVPLHGGVSGYITDIHEDTGTYIVQFGEHTAMGYDADMIHRIAP